jgi:putative oxidoreductase
VSATIFLIGRILLGGAFIVFGIRNLKNVERLSGVIAKKGIPQPRAWIYVGIGIQLVGGLAVATGILAAWGAAALIAFLYLAVYWFHDFWRFPAAERYPHITAWVMNTALAGAFLMVIATYL